MQVQNNVRFCLICNYVSKIDESLRNEFIRLRFNQLPDDNVVGFLKIINEKETLNLCDNDLLGIKRYFGSDVRSMINYMQSSKTFYTPNMIINDEKWEYLIDILSNKVNNKHIKKLNDYFKEVCKLYKMPIKTVMKEFINFIIRKYTNNITVDFLDFSEFIIHLQETNNDDLLGYSMPKLIKSIPLICNK